MTCLRTIASQTNRFTLFLGLLCAVSGFAVAAEPQPLVLQGGAVFDPIVGNFRPDQTIVIDGDRIRSVSGPNADLSRGARTMDCRGKYIIPGLIDAHVHLVHLANSSHVVGDQFLPMFLANGVTSVRDAGDPIVAQSVIARSAELRPELCPRVFLASPLIDSDPPIHRDYGYALTDPAKVRPFVDDMVKWNVTTLKTYAGTPRTVGHEVIKEGHRAGLRVMAHLVPTRPKMPCSTAWIPGAHLVSVQLRHPG